MVNLSLITLDHDLSQQSSSDLDHSQRMLKAIKEGDIEAVKNFIKAGANLNITSGSGSPLIFFAIAIHERFDIGKFLIEAGAPVDATNYHGFSALMWAAIAGDTDTAKMLIEAGANVNISEPENGSTALLLAAQDGHIGVLKLLVQAGANIYAKYTNGETVNMTKLGYPDIVRFMSHCHITNATLALAPLELSPYVLLWIFQWAYNIKDDDQLRVIRLVENVQRSRARK